VGQRIILSKFCKDQKIPVQTLPPSQLVRQKEVEEDSDATVLMEDDPLVIAPSH
jgi:hypothetical protein